MKKKQIEHCLRIARKHLPKHPQWDAYKHYSFIFQNNKLIEWGCNRTSEPTIGYPEYGKRHSEVDAWYKAKGLMDKKSFEVLNIRMNCKGDLKISKPCSCCYEFLKRLGCSGVWFSVGEIGFAKILIN